MKISSDNKIHILDTLNKPEQLKNGKQAATGAKEKDAVVDKVEFSQTKAEVEKLQEKAMAVPPTRQEKIAAIKQSIEDGTYNVKGELIAKSMLKNHLMDELL